MTATAEITTTVKHELYRVHLAIANGPMIRDAFEEKAKITGVHITYSDRKPTAIRFESEQNHDVFVDPMDLDKPESWPSWLREMVDTHHPADRTSPDLSEWLDRRAESDGVDRADLVHEAVSRFLNELDRHPRR